MIKNNRALFLLITASLITLSACDTNTDSNTINNTEAESTIETEDTIDSTEAEVSIDSEPSAETEEEVLENEVSEDENQADAEPVESELFGEITQVYENDGKIYADFDKVEWLVWTPQNLEGKEKIIALEEMENPGKCEVESNCMPPNGFYIHNESESNETFEIGNAEIKLLNETVSDHEIHTAEEFNSMFNDTNSTMYGSPYYDLNMMDGVVASIEQVYTP